MSAKNALVEQIEKLSEPVIVQQGAELVDLEFLHEQGQWVLRFFLDKPEGITLDDCADFSERLGQLLDETNVISQSYSLEVSSPGINRRLRKPGDFRKYVGERVDVSMFAPVNGQRRFQGILSAVELDSIVVKDDDDKNHALPLAGVAKAKLDPEIKI